METLTDEEQKKQFRKCFLGKIALKFMVSILLALLQV